MFTFGLPDPTSYAVTSTDGEGQPQLVEAAPEVEQGVTEEIQAQTDSLVNVMRAIADAISAQINGQYNILTAVQSTINGAVAQQLAGQRAAAELALGQISNWISDRLARQQELVQTVAINAAMLPQRGYTPYQQPGPPPRPSQPGQPWRPGTGPQPPPGPRPTGPGVPDMPPIRPDQQPDGPQPWRPGGGGTIPLTQQPPDPYTPPQTPPQPSTVPMMPTDPFSSTMPLGPWQTGTQPFDPTSRTFTQTSTQQQGTSTIPLTPPDPSDWSTTTRPGDPPLNPPPASETTPLPPPWFSPSQSTQTNTQYAPPPQQQFVQQQTDADVSPPQQEDTEQPDINLEFDPTINITVNVKQGDSYSTSTATATVNEDDRQQIDFAPENEERDGPTNIANTSVDINNINDIYNRMRINIAPEDDERDRQRLRRIFNQAAQPDGDEPVKMEGCPWQLGMKIPKIGSPEWCAQAPAIAQGLALAGNTILNFLTNHIDALATGITEQTTAALKRGEWGGNTILQKIVQTIMTQPITSLKLIRAMTECWRQIASLAPACDGRIIMGLSGVRMVVKLLRMVQIGINAAVFSIVNLEIQLDPIEAAIEYLMHMLCPTMLPTPEDAWSAYVAGYINDQTWRCWTLCAGADPDLWRPVLESTGNRLGADQVILWARLSGEDQKAIDAALFQRGWTRETDRAIAQELYDHWSGGEEYIRWRRDGCMSPGLADQYQLDDGFSAWWQGEPGQMARAHGWREDEARFNYRAMWVRPGAAEMQMYFWRMREGGSAARKGVTEGVIRGVMELQGVLPWHEEAVIACLYRPLSQPEALLMVQTGQTTWKEILTSGIDSGLTDDQADRMATATQYAGERARAMQEGGWTVTSLAAARSIGYAPNVDAMEALGRQGVTDEMVDTQRTVGAVTMRAQIRREGRRKAAQAAVSAAMIGHRVGITTDAVAIRTMVAAGWDAASATTVLQAQNMTLRAQRTSRIIRALESAVLKGEVTGLAAAVVMAQMGLRPDAIDTYIELWKADSLSRRPHTSARDIRMLVAEGLLSLPAAKLRLANLGWKDPDLTLQMMVAQQRLAKAQTMAQARSAKQMAQAARDAEKIKQLALRRLEKHRPVSALGQWYREGVLTRDQVERRMTKYGYDMNTIGLYIASWTHQMQRGQKQQTSGVAVPLKAPEKQVPMATLKRWFINGIVDRSFTDGRLKDYGYDDPTRKRYLEEWEASALDRKQRAEAKSQA